MTPSTSRTTVIALIICMALPAWGQQYLLYSPQPAPPGKKSSSPDGILVQEIEIQKGDTLYKLSRKSSGRGMYFPQILLFNSIKNPNLIYEGKTLRVPIAQKDVHGSDRIDAKPAGTNHKKKRSGNKKTPLRSGAAPAVRQLTAPSPVSSPGNEPSSSESKTGGSENIRQSRHKKETAVHAKKNLTKGSSTTPTSTVPAADKAVTASVPPAEIAAGQKLFEAAVKAYRQDDCRTALELLDRYLVNNSNSPLAADANLYKADCYLKLSAQ